MATGYQQSAQEIRGGGLESLRNRLGEQIGVNRVSRFGLKTKQPQVNAFALPSKEVFVYSGLLRTLPDDDAMLAAVLAHEIAHVAERHSVENLGASEPDFIGDVGLTSSCSSSMSPLWLSTFSVASHSPSQFPFRCKLGVSRFVSSQSAERYKYHRCSRPVHQLAPRNRGSACLFAQARDGSRQGRSRAHGCGRI